MQDDINNIDKPDNFSQFVRQKLENHQSPVDADSWNEIEAWMKAQKRRIIPFWFWFSGGAAVAVLALLFTFRTIEEPANYTKNNYEKKTQPKQVAAFEKGKIAQNEKPKIYSTNQKSFIQNNSNLEINVSQIQSISKDTVENNNTTSNLAESSLKNNITSAPVSDENKDSVSIHKRIISNSLVEESVNEPIIKNKNKSEWLLAATFGSGGGAPSGSNGYEFASVDKNIVTAQTNFTDIMAPKDFSKITYNSPLSFGVVIRKNLDKTISLESGLVYTYLSTNFENNGVQQNNARLHLHYIGIPLNLVGLVWRNSKWDIYFSGGTMVEKGIRSVYIQNQIYENQTITTTASTNIDGFQWSVNGAIGTTYKLQRNIGIFFEPKISYFFDNNQPISARTDQSTVIGLTAGLRFQF